MRKADKLADLIIGNNVLSHNPNLNDFVEGLKVALKPNGIITMEFPHLLKLLEGNQFDTIRTDGAQPMDWKKPFTAQINIIPAKKLLVKPNITLSTAEPNKPIPTNFLALNLSPNCPLTN